MVLACMGPYIGYLSFPLIIVGVLFDKTEIRKYLSFFVVFVILGLSSVQSVLLGFDFNVLSFMVSTLTILVLFLIKNHLLIRFYPRIITIVAYTVPVALIIAVLQTMGYYPFGFRSNEVIGLMRFTFLFSEPSHYSLILSLSALIALIKPTDLHLKILLLCGLLLTWSLSGFCILGFGYISYKFYSRGILRSFVLLLVLFALALYLWFFWLENSDFWLASKIESIIQLYSDENVGASSAMLRYNSIIMGPYFIFEHFYLEYYWSVLLGLGFGNLSHWVEYYYESQYLLHAITDANNIISNVLISSGVIGLVCYFFAYCYFTGLNLMKIFFSAIMILILSLFSGYAFGPFALITLLLTRIYILMVTDYDKVSEY